MSEEQLNQEHIRNKLRGICQDCMWFDKTIPVINEMCREAYISGFEQGKFDIQMGLQQKVEQLESTIKETKEYIEKHSLYTEDYDYDEEDNLVLCCVSDYDQKCDLLDILNKGSETNDS